MYPGWMPFLWHPRNLKANRHIGEIVGEHPEVLLHDFLPFMIVRYTVMTDCLVFRNGA